LEILLPKFGNIFIKNIYILSRRIDSNRNLFLKEHIRRYLKILIMGKNFAKQMDSILLQTVCVNEIILATIYQLIPFTIEILEAYQINIQFD
jgi:hypothetical protein